VIDEGDGFEGGDGTGEKTRDELENEVDDLKEKLSEKQDSLKSVNKSLEDEREKVRSLNNSRSELVERVKDLNESLKDAKKSDGFLAGNSLPASLEEFVFQVFSKVLFSSITGI